MKRRHPAQVTADRLAGHAEDYYDLMTGTERDELSRAVFVLEQIAEGQRAGANNEGDGR